MKRSIGEKIFLYLKKCFFILRVDDDVLNKIFLLYGFDYKVFFSIGFVFRYGLFMW